MVGSLGESAITVKVNSRQLQSINGYFGYHRQNRKQKKEKCKAGSPVMTIEDGAAVAEMEHQSFSDAWVKKRFWKRSDSRQPSVLGRESRETVGYLLAYQAADEIEIARVAVVEEVKRQGVGTALMKKLQEEERSERLERSFLMYAKKLYSTGIL